MSALSRKLLLLIRIVVSVGLIAFMLSRLDLENMLRFLRRADLWLVLLTLVAVFVDRLFSAAGKAAAERRGIVAESMNAAGYSFIRVDEKGGSVWLAAPETPLEVGQTIEWTGGGAMHNFTSRSLNRVFDEIIFVDSVQIS